MAWKGGVNNHLLLDLDGSDWDFNDVDWQSDLSDDDDGVGRRGIGGQFAEVNQAWDTIAARAEIHLMQEDQHH